MQDLRKYASQTNFRLIIGTLIILLVVGEGLIWLIYGGPAALMGLLCIGAGLIPVGIIILVLAVMDTIIKNQRGE